MAPPIVPESSYLVRMADGTIKQVNPFTGTEVWTVPSRGQRPLAARREPPTPLDPARRDTERLQRLLQPFPASLMRAWPVSPRVNSPRSDDRDCIAPLAG